jgi:hypothetical protein
MELTISSEERIRDLEQRANAIGAEIKRLDEARELAAQQIKLLQLGRTDDATLALIAISVLTLVSLIEAVAIFVLWWSR